MKTALLIIALLVGAFALAYGGWTAYRWFIKGANIKRRSPWVAGVSLLLSVVLGIGAFAPWAKAPDAPATQNADNPGITINLDDVEVNMSGFGTREQVLTFLKNGFGADFDRVMRSVSDYEFLAVDQTGEDNDQAKIQANKAYLKAIGYGKKYPDGFRNAVLFPTSVITADVYKQLGTMPADELSELYTSFRWKDIYAHLVTSIRYQDMILQLLETYDEFNKQNESWAPALRETLNRAKTDEEFLNTLYVTETDGSIHLNEDMQVNGGRLCLVLENAVDRGVETPTSTTNWELPSLNPEPKARWTVVADKEENLPAMVLIFPSTKSGDDTYKVGFNLADLRAEKFNPAEDPSPVTPPDTTPPPPTTTPTHQVHTYYRDLNTKADIAQSTSQTIAEGKGWSTSAKPITGYVYHSNSNGNSSQTVSGTMGKSDVTVIFYYTPSDTRTTNVNLTVYHKDATTGSLLRQEGPLSVPEGSQQTVSAQTIPNYRYAGYYSVDGGSHTNGTSATVTMNGDRTVTFFYDKEVKSYTVTALYKVEGTGTVLDTVTLTRKPGEPYSTTQKSFTGYTFTRTTGDPTSGTMPERDVQVIYWYTKNAQSFTVTTIHRAVDSNHVLGQSSKTVKVGESYSTSSSSFPGYRYSHQTGDAASGTMPARNVEVTYWYELIKQDGNGNKDPDAGPGNNGSGNATEGIGPGHGDEDHYIPPTITDTDKQEGDEPTSNHKPTDNPGGQGAGSENRQEVGNETVSGIVGDDEDTPSSGTGGHDPGHVDTGATEVEGGGYTPPEKEPIKPDEGPSSSDPVVGADETLDFVP